MSEVLLALMPLMFIIVYFLLQGDEHKPTPTYNSIGDLEAYVSGFSMGIKKQ